ncbi:MAG: DUF1501 domain-containing protein [Gemmataceae bacterium]
MLLVGGHRTRTCQGVSRRELLQVGACSALGLSALDLLRQAGRAEAAGRVKSVLLLWLWGGPSHLDTWDPKPAAPAEYRGPFTTIPTRTVGARVCELFPQIANRTNQIAIIRSLKTGSNDHGVAGTIGLTGSSSGGVGLNGLPLPGTARPTVGSAVARVRGFAGQLPPFLVVGGKLHQGKKPIVGEGGGALGGLYDPFRLIYDHESGQTQVPALQLPANLTPDRLGDRAKLLRAFDGLSKAADDLRSARVLSDYRHQAFAMLTSPAARKAFDLSGERDAVKERYGLTRFGQSCLLGRRLVEAAVPFVQVNWSDHVEAEEDAGDGGWDHHYRNFQIMQDRHAPWLDQAVSALLDDLAQRGLLSSTLVIAVGEFGRSPKVNDKAGRDHWEHCFSGLVFGGGVRGGQVIGASTPRGEHVQDRPVTSADLVTTVQHVIGVTSEQSQTLGVAIEGGKVVEGLF